MLQLTFILTIGLQIVCFGQSFSGQAFILSKEFLENKCEVYAPCDCCATNLFFLTDKEFGMVNRCMYYDSYYKGTYSIKDSKLTLTFKQKVVSEIMDEVSSKVTYKTKVTKIEPKVFTIDKCNNKVRLRHPTTVDLSNGSRYPVGDEKELTKELEKETAWKMVSQ
jgi:hypothetical protein